MSDRLRHGLGVLLLLVVAALSGFLAWLQLDELLTALASHADRLLAGPGMFYGAAAAAILVLLACVILYADIAGNRLPPGAMRAVRRGLLGAVVLLVAVPFVGHAVLDDHLARHGYRACGPESWHRFTRIEWTAASCPR